MSNFTLPDVISGRPFALYGLVGKKAVVLVFLGTDCPLARLYAPRLAELSRDYRSRGVSFVGIDSNALENDPAIREFAEKFALGFPILKDQGNVVADLALVERTPEVLVLDGRARICYRGAIDDQYGQGTRKPEAGQHYLKDALDAILAGRTIVTKATQPAGCLLDRIEPKQAGAAPPRVRPAPREVQAVRQQLEPQAQAEVGQVTYSSGAARVIQEKCQSCHRPGQVAPFSLLTYDDARKHAAMIQEVVDSRRMPPWHADPRYGRFANDRSLSTSERATLIAWAEQGAPLGDPRQIPAPRTFPEGWTIGKPDLVIEIPQIYTVPAQGVVEYVHFRVPTKFTEDRWIQAAEAQPGDRAVVHHIVAYVDEHKENNRNRGDLAHLCGYAPGDMPSVYPPGSAKKIPAGADLVFQLHYTPIGRIRTDRSRVGLIFAKAPVTREAHTVGIAEREFLIPPRNDNVPVGSSLTLEQDVRLLSFMPHMHLRGKDFQYKITRPGKPAEVILSVPAYDFGWQSYYTLSEPLELPKGTRIDCLAHFDNSEKNPYNPDPTKTVRWGDQTFEEMMIGYVDIDLPRGNSLIREPKARAELKPRAREVIQAVGILFGFPLGSSAQPAGDRFAPR
jgi:thiol-disulfide isomerase/thioredoxin